MVASSFAGSVGAKRWKKSFLSKISFQDFPPLIGSAFAFVAELDGIFSQIDFDYIPVCKKGETQQAWLHKQRARVLWRGTLWKDRICIVNKTIRIEK